MPTILDRIVEHKKLEVQRRRGKTPIGVLTDSPRYAAPRKSLSEAIRSSTDFGIVSEFKRKSPSQEDINLAADPASVSTGYAAAGVAGISCLTDVHFFGAQPTDIDVVRSSVRVPVLRKDFTIDAYQLHEAKAMGADAVLLIASILSPAQLDELAKEACELGLEVLCEVHDAAEIGKLSPDVDIVGVNNRNLNDFSVDIATSLRLLEMLPPSLVRISESGIEDPQSIAKLKHAGYEGFLIGTYFMREADPAAACAAFIQRCHDIENTYQGALA